MQYLSLLVLFTCLSLQFGFSQVKKQYLDNKNTASTVVVKENNVSDKNILSSQFDINSIGLGQEIRIKNEKDFSKPTLTKIPLAEVALEEVVLEEIPLAEVPKDILTPKGEKVIKKVIVKKAVKQKRMPARAVATMPRVKKKPTEIYYKGIGKSSTKKVKMKKRKLVKRKKIKKRKRRKVRCYSF